MHFWKISHTLDSEPGVAITSPASVRSQSNRSRDIPSGRIAIESHPRRAELYAPPRQKLPVEGHAARWKVGSNCPVARRGTRHPNVAPTLCAPVGNHFPTRAITRARTPVSSGGNVR